MKKSAKLHVDETSIIGAPIRPLQGFVVSGRHHKKVVLPELVHIGAYVIIGEGVVLGERVIVDDFCKIGRGVTIGNDTLIIYSAVIGGDAVVGDNCVIGGRLSENCAVDDNCRVFGQVIHKHANSMMSWDHHEVPEPAVKIKENSFVGFGAMVAGDITIGPNSYVCGMSVVTRDVPPYHIAFNRNEVLHFSEWKGSLKNNPIFMNSE